MSNIKNINMEKNNSYSVICKWTEPNGEEEWDIIHKGPNIL